MTKRAATRVALVLWLVSGDVLFAHEYKVGELTIQHPWLRAAPAGHAAAGGYVTITNRGRNPDRLLSVSIEGAGQVGLHETQIVGGIAWMRPVPAGILLPPGQTVELKPGSLHLMLSGMRAPLERDTLVAGTLVFEKAGALAIEFFVEPAAAVAPHRH